MANWQDMTLAERQAYEKANTAAVRRGYLVILLVLFLLVLVFFGLTFVVKLIDCRMLRTREATAAEIQPVLAYLSKHATGDPTVSTFVGLWGMTEVPRVLVTTCSTGLDSHHFMLQGDAFVISQSLWETTGNDSLALKAKVLIGEFQHTRLGGNLKDTQSTQDALDNAIGQFPIEDLTPRVKNAAHKGTVSKWNQQPKN